MANPKHIVKCFYCSQSFDANKEEFVKVNSRRYAHKACYDQQQAQKSQEEKDYDELEQYIKKLFNIQTLSAKIQKQIKTFHEENKYSYSGIRRSLIYFFEIEGNSIEKANDGIGIVPYVWDRSFRYYYSLWEAQQKNANKTLDEFKSNDIFITITPPKKQKRTRKLFTFLDEKETDI